MFLHADSEDSDQTGRMPTDLSLRWAQRSFCWFCHEVAQMLHRTDQGLHCLLLCFQFQLDYLLHQKNR